MNFKRPRDEVVYAAQAAARNAFCNKLQQILPSTYHIKHDSTLSAVSEAVSYAIGMAILELMDNVYTDVEFEEDLTLREKS